MLKLPDKLKEKNKPALFFELLRDPDRKPIFRMIYEFCYLIGIYREIPVHYFSRYLFKKDMLNIRDYLPNRFISNRISPFFNDRIVTEVLDDKLFFDLFYRQFDLNLPKILMYNCRQMFVIGTTHIEVKNVHEFRTLLVDLFKENPSIVSIFIKKTVCGSCGSNIHRLFLNELQTDQLKVGEIYSEVINSEFIFQEALKQNHVLNVLNPSCLNTIRFDTFIDKSGQIDIISAYLRISINDNYIDNISAGGCQVGIDLQNGKLKKVGYSIFKYSGTRVYTEHPKTKIIFENFEIPYFAEAKDLVLHAASFMTGLRLVGWDVAICESGPVLIEGNSDYDICGNDLADGGYLTNPVFRKVLNEINYL